MCGPRLGRTRAAHSIITARDALFLCITGRFGLCPRARGSDFGVTIVECRPPWRADIGPEWTRLPIARLRFTQSTGLWSLYWRDRNLHFHVYDRARPTSSIEDLLVEIDRNPTAIFWG